MTSLLNLNPISEASLIADFFQQSSGRWKSERRYYTLPDGETKEVVSVITVRFLEQRSPELIHLAELHGIDGALLSCGAEVLWDSHDSATGKPQSAGSTLFGASGATLYRDRGFATTKPVSAAFHFPNPTTLCLRTEYKGSVFEEELKLIGRNYRTRQTIISRAGEQMMIGQYLEKRI